MRQEHSFRDVKASNPEISPIVVGRVYESSESDNDWQLGMPRGHTDNTGNPWAGQNVPLYIPLVPTRLSRRTVQFVQY